MNLDRSKLFKTYFTSCNSNDTKPTFEDFLRKNCTSIRNAIDSTNTEEFSNWFVLFSKSAIQHGFENVKKGYAAKVWNTLVVFKEPASAKRGYTNANVIEVIEGFKPTKHQHDDFVFDDYNISEAAKKHVDNSLAFIKSHCTEARRFKHDMNKWLAIHNIVKLNKQLDTDLVGTFSVSTMEALCHHFRTQVFGRPTRFRTTLKVEILDLLAQYEETRDSKKLKTELSSLVAREDGAVSRTIESIMIMFNKMMQRKKTIGEKKVEDVLEAVWGSLFKVSDKHDPHKFDNALFGSPHPLERCHPSYAVEVDEDVSFINLVGEVKPSSFSPSGLALDTYRLGVFSVALLEKHGLKCILAFQAKGLEVTFYLCFYHFGMYFMSEVETICFPSTYDEYCQFGSSLDALLNVSALYESHCQQQQQQQKQKQQQETNIFSYGVLKNVYELSTSKHSKTNDEASSSTDVPSFFSSSSSSHVK